MSRTNDVLSLSLAYAKVVAKMHELGATDAEWNYANQLVDKIKNPTTIGIMDAFQLQLNQSPKLTDIMLKQLNTIEYSRRTNGLTPITFQEGDRVLAYVLLENGKTYEAYTTDRHIFEIMAVMDVVGFDLDDVLVYTPESVNVPVLKLKQWYIDEPVQMVKEIRQLEDARVLKDTFDLVYAFEVPPKGESTNG